MDEACRANQESSAAFVRELHAMRARLHWRGLSPNRPDYPADSSTRSTDGVLFRSAWIPHNRLDTPVRPFGWHRRPSGERAPNSEPCGRAFVSGYVLLSARHLAVGGARMLPVRAGSDRSSQRAVLGASGR